MRSLITFLSIMGCICLTQTASAQLLNKMKQKLEDKALQATDNALNGRNKSVTNTGNTSSPAISTGSNGSATSGSGTTGRARNKGGAGLISTPPDVKQNLTDAETAFKAQNFDQSRYALQQAMLGVEMEIGQKILKSLPETISGLKKVEEADQVTSSGFGWAGLTIQRQYNNTEEKELTLTIANNAVYMAAVNAYLTNGNYGQTTGGNQKWKQTTLKGNRGVIEYDESTGYKLTVPLGQSSLLVYEGVNFKDEKDIMAAANVVDIAGIKKMLGEQ